jgi:hypothetical protein
MVSTQQNNNHCKETPDWKSLTVAYLSTKTESTASTAATQEEEESRVWSPLLASATLSSPEWMEGIIDHPSLRLLDLERRPRKKLKPRHKLFFVRSNESSSFTTSVLHRDDEVDAPPHAPPNLFERLALACCDAGVVPRKEFFETYASARWIHESFPESVNRVADLAAGHGLLSWMILAMDTYDEEGSPKKKGATMSRSNNNNDTNHLENRPRRTAICVDRRMPPSAMAIARSMRKHLFPIESENGDNDDDDDDDDDGEDDEKGLYDRRWTYVEADLGNVVVNDASTLLVSVHACGTLSDYLIELAISAADATNIINATNGGVGGAPLALVPCCHTYSARKGYAPHPLFSGTTAELVRGTIERLQETTTHTQKANSKRKTHRKFQIVENVIDEVRLNTLRNAGYRSVGIASLPNEFTERNRLFLARGEQILRETEDGEGDNPGGTVENYLSPSTELSEEVPRRLIRRGSMPPATEAAAAAVANPRPTTDEDYPVFAVPLRDDPESIEKCLSVSGKAKAIERLRAMIPNHFAPKLDVSMWLSPPLPHSQQQQQQQQQQQPNAASTNDDDDVTLQALQQVLDETVRSYRQTKQNNNTEKNDDKHRRYRCTIAPINEVFVHPDNGRMARIFQIEYSYESSKIEENGAPFPKKVAKELHKSFCDNVVSSIDGTEIR